ncbi:PLC-like phosphodiesterase [Polychaeton citri CBS 116435]|uniref:glycerophosphodiester phosphodiesterase n=1 Tax=Polychaeton citri CBS 116435 TaxID=1314669 RepID=A0A9P4Q553_9PEZI|nr:PLC-like phosphodiesterase [Polychaeton citri CBS 116435]
MVVAFRSLALVACAGSLAVAIPAPWGRGGQWPWPHHGGHKAGSTTGINVQLGPRPFYLVDNMDEGPLKDKLESCSEGPFSTSSFSISHRGAPLMFPEHSREGYMAAARMGAGIIECDVSFTSDEELVCRHSNCDLQYTTDILAHPELAAKCSEPFKPYDPATGEAASAKCCTSDITLSEFKSLCAEMEATTYNALNISADSPDFGRIGTTPDWRTNMYAYSCAETMSLRDQIQFVESMGLNFTAEAKTPEVPMPFKGNYTQADFAQQIVDTFRQEGIAADRVWLQSFLPDDIFYWIANDPDFGAQAIYLDERADLSADGYDVAVASLPDLAAKGVQIVAPSIWQLVTADNATGKIVPSSYAIAAKSAGLEIITWSFDRSGPLEGGGGYYYESVSNLINNDGDEYTVIDVIAQQVGATKIFADWAAIVTYYANCFGLV